MEERGPTTESAPLIPESISNIAAEPRRAPAAPVTVSDRSEDLRKVSQKRQPTQSLQTAPVEVKTPDGQSFRPTRRVREPIGGGSAQIGALFGDGSEDHEEAVREAEREQSKRRGIAAAEVTSKPVERKVTRPLSTSSSDNIQAPQSSSDGKMDVSGFRPTRRVR